MSAVWTNGSCIAAASDADAIFTRFARASRTTRTGDVEMTINSVRVARLF
jgi:hypothetical protein